MCAHAHVSVHVGLGMYVCMVWSGMVWYGMVMVMYVCMYVCMHVRFNLSRDFLCVVFWHVHVGLGMYVCMVWYGMVCVW